MGFLQPLWLLGLGFAAIPPLLHLIGRKVPPLILFPAIRYLAETERKQSRRLRLRHLLLLILRTLIIALIALAASRPLANLPFGAGHEPMEVAIVVDNSLSSGAVVEGERMLDELVARARSVISGAVAEDHLWLVLADGIPQRVTQSEASGLLDTLDAWPVRLDLVAAVSTVWETMKLSGWPTAEVVVLSDLQATALSGTSGLNARVLVWEPPLGFDGNRSIDSAWSEPAVWAPEGSVLGVLGGTEGDVPTTVGLSVEGREWSRTIGRRGDRVVLAASLRPGWHEAIVRLDPDELRADDQRRLAVFVAPPASVAVRPGAGPFVEEALAVLAGAGRTGSGPLVVLDDGPAAVGTTIVFPPADPALVGAVNRMLQQRGIGWQFGPMVDGEWDAEDAVAEAPTAAIRRRYRLDGGGGAVIGRVGGDPWLVRDGNVVLVGSRLDLTWTDLPIHAGFVPFLDFLVNRVAGRAAWMVPAEPGGRVELPAVTEAVLTPEGPIPVGGDHRVVAPMATGVYYLRGVGTDTVGALEVNADPLESDLRTASRPVVRSTLGRDAEVLSDRGMSRELFGGARRADLTGILVVLAILLAVTEMIVATLGGGRAEP